jgi:hypothetical protein
MKVGASKIYTDQSLDSSFNGDPILLDQIFGYSFHVTTSGDTEAGTFLLQVSDEDCQGNPERIPESSWIDYPGASQVIAAGDDVMFEISNVFHLWVRLVWESSSGSGTCNVSFVSKGV